MTSMIECKMDTEMSEILDLSELGFIGSIGCGVLNLVV
jgi:hypothetical protein